MKCPVCKKKMEVRSKDSSWGNDKKEYSRKIYVCKDCDTWITVEAPKKLSSQT